MESLSTIVLADCLQTQLISQRKQLVIGLEGASNPLITAVWGNKSWNKKT
jgi:hypothetical protein